MQVNLIIEGLRLSRHPTRVLRGRRRQAPSRVANENVNEFVMLGVTE